MNDIKLICPYCNCKFTVFAYQVKTRNSLFHTSTTYSAECPICNKSVTVGINSYDCLSERFSYIQYNRDDDEKFVPYA